MVAHANKTPTRTCNAREEVFCRLVVQGHSQAEAWRRAYIKPNSTDRNAAEQSCKLAKRPCVVARIAELRAKTEAKVLLSVNDRLHKLATAADFVPKTAAERQAQARLMEAYTKIAGGAAPIQVEHSGPGGGPMQTQVTASVTVRSAPIRERIAALRAARG